MHTLRAVHLGQRLGQVSLRGLGQGKHKDLRYGVLGQK
jgi:hypothetical protein